jgi:peptidoglycan hydrolase CwlO-like protein
MEISPLRDKLRDAQKELSNAKQAKKSYQERIASLEKQIELQRPK